MEGFINFNKSKGPSSQNAVAAMRRLFHVKAGHCGTLDPAADGVLPIALGAATRLADYVTADGKQYVAGIVFGVETDSYDGAGEVLARADASPLRAAQIEALLPRFIGDILQTPPAVSALKQGGVPAYKRLRRGEEVTMEPRPVHIDGLRLVEFRPGVQAYAEVEVCCGKGVYVRSLAHDLGQLLGVGGHICRLTRTRVGDFALAQAYNEEQIRQMLEVGDTSFLLPVQYPLSRWPVYRVDEQERDTILYGNPLYLPVAGAPFSLGRVEDADGRLLALASLTAQEDGSGILQPKKVLSAAPPPKPKGFAAVAIGNFDGVHLGHKALLEDLAAQKKRYGGTTAALTFEPHPLQVICGQAPPLLNSPDQKRRLICDVYGADELIALPFDRHLMNASPEQFFAAILQDKLQARSITVGYNFTFAAHGYGTAEILRQLGQAAGVEVRIIGEVSSAAGAVSSTAIRTRLAAGELEAVNEMLGYWYTLEGTVIFGNQLGRTIGFPTANLLPEKGLALPPLGVYAARIVHQDKTYDGVVNFGYKPTIGGEKEPLVEAHLFDTELNLYGETLQVFFGHFLRPEKRYTSMEQLQQQIDRDSQQARRFLHDLATDCHLPKPII